MLTLLALLLAPPSFGEDAHRIIQVAPAHDGTFYYAASPEAEGGCSVSLRAPRRAEVISETDTHFELRWEKRIPAGCYLDRVWQGLSMHQGFVRKSDVIWEDAGAEELPSIASANLVKDVLPPECQDTVVIPKAELENGDVGTIGELLHALRRKQAGMKQPKDIDKYMECYPYGQDGLDNYRKYRRYLDMAGNHFRIEFRDTPLEVHPALLACLFRRESGYDPKNKSHTAAVGLGQHTTINIKDMSQRLNKKGSWEGALWRAFFEKVKRDPEGRKLLAACPGTGHGVPVFNSKTDAACPLQSIAASSIYNLLIQRELKKSAKVHNIEWEQELEYQLAIGAAYNLGNGAASDAVEDLFVGGWVKSILSNSPSASKKKEVAAHITALRNCMSSKSWAPMVKTDRPQCENFPGAARGKGRH